MWIFLFLLIPIITAAYLLYKYPKNTTWWEAAVTVIIPMVVVILIKFLSQQSLMYSNEYWNSYATEARYYEDWNEEVIEIHYTYDSDGNISGSYTTTSIDYHPPYWELHGNCGETANIPESTFNNLKTLWNNNAFVELHRGFYDNDGDLYTTKWDNIMLHIETITTMHNYKNKVKSSSSVFGYKKIDKKITPVIEYNKINNYSCDFIYNYKNMGDQDYLRRWNAYLGAKKKVVIMIIPYYKGKLEDAFNQEAYWTGGNKNEFIACIGISSSTINWVHIISWTPLTVLKAQIAREIKEMKTVNMFKIVEYLGNTIDKTPGFVRKDFEEFNYISVPVPLWGYIIAGLLSIIVSFGMAMWVIENEFNTDGSY